MEKEEQKSTGLSTAYWGGLGSNVRQDPAGRMHIH